jgi:DNA-directed RNA polymerase subunit E'/Rpb7
MKTKKEPKLRETRVSKGVSLENRETRELTYKTVISKKVSLEPIYLSAEYKDYIIKQINKDMKGSCIKEYGYIIDIFDNIEIGESVEIVNNGNVIFPVKIPCLCFKPEAGTILTGRIELLTKDCIRVTKDQLKLIISVPFDKCLDYVYNERTNTYKNKNSELKKGSEIQVKIDYINYTFKNYTCIAQMV